jgi:hypothetical protein
MELMMSKDKSVKYDAVIEPVFFGVKNDGRLIVTNSEQELKEHGFKATLADMSLSGYMGKVNRKQFYKRMFQLLAAIAGNKDVALARDEDTHQTGDSFGFFGDINDLRKQAETVAEINRLEGEEFDQAIKVWMEG